MIPMFRRAIIPAIAAVALIVCGCGPGMGTVTGTVTYEGQPVEDGQVIFTPSDGKGPTAAGKITNGEYKAENVPPGPKIVKIEAYKKVNFASSSQEMMDKAKEAKKRGDDSGLVDPADIIPPNAEGNSEKFEVKVGPQTKDFTLSKPKKK